MANKKVFRTQTEIRFSRMRKAIIILSITCAVLAAALGFIFTFYTLVPHIIWNF